MVAQFTTIGQVMAGDGEQCRKQSRWRFGVRRSVRRNGAPVRIKLRTRM